MTKRVRTFSKAPHVMHKLSTFFSTKDISREMRLYCCYILRLYCGFMNAFLRYCGVFVQLSGSSADYTMLLYILSENVYYVKKLLRNFLRKINEAVLRPPHTSLSDTHRYLLPNCICSYILPRMPSVHFRLLPGAGNNHNPGTFHSRHTRRLCW